jgi:phosphate transport system substrate-binding protein
MTRYLYVIVKANGRAEEQAGDAYAELLLTKQVTKQGQDAIASVGFVPTR